MDKDFFHFENLLLYSEILVEKKMLADLYTCATNMVENYPSHFMTYHLLGMYQFMLGKYSNAQNYFNKAINLNKYSLKSWLMYGHALAL